MTEYTFAAILEDSTLELLEELLENSMITLKDIKKLMHISSGFERVKLRGIAYRLETEIMALKAEIRNRQVISLEEEMPPSLASSEEEEEEDTPTNE